MTKNGNFQTIQGFRRMALTATVGAMLLLFCVGTVWAFDEYDGCEDCHGSFNSGNYTSLQDGTSWGTNLMSGHEPWVGGTCNACHKSGGFGEVFLNLSDDSTLSKSCVGCHGRDEDVNGSCTGLAGDDGVEAECGSGAGLRQHHETEVGAGTCSGCHSGDPTPVGEDTAPSNYGKSGVVMMNSCDADGTESQFGDTGLDNDGDGLADAADPDCQTQGNTPPTQPGMLSASAVTANSATVSWGASTDDDSDTITYQVDYRKNGDTSYSDGGSTTNTSKALSGLAANQAYDVRVTPNDGTDDGDSRDAMSLFMTTEGSSFLMTAGQNGNWWNGLARNGEGAQVEVSDGGDGTLTLVVTVYSYDDMGNQIFLIAVGTVNGDSADVEVFITEGGLWGENYDPALVVESAWGVGKFTAFSCELMHLMLMPNAEFQAKGYTDLEYDMMRLTTPAMPCPIPPPN